jgi:[ribosomal protein S5]-alanine N-acetyltransferase
MTMDRIYRIPDSFETSRYHLRRVTPEDASQIFESYASDAIVTKHLGWRPHAALRETESFVESAAGEWETGRGFPLVVFTRTDPDDLIGMFHPHVGRGRVNYGYALARRVWGYGCATEILTWLVDHALAHPAIFRAEAFCDVDNLASARVMQKAGMTKEGVLRRYFVHPNVSEHPQDCVMYARVR